MVLTFFRKGESGMDHITAQIVTMLGDARHSFDVACTALLSGADPDQVTADIEATDERINQAENALRRELVVHVSVHGAVDIGQVLGYTLLIKKVERIGDQAKNIVELVNEGVSLHGADDVAEFLEAQRQVSELYGDVGALLLDPDEATALAVRGRAVELDDHHAARIRALLHSSEPAEFAVPRAMLHRYLKRIVANLGGIAITITEPLRGGDDDD